MKLTLGNGKTGIHPAMVDNDIAVVFTTLGTGVVGEKTTNKDVIELPPENEKLVITFDNEKSLDVLIAELRRVKTLFNGVDIYSC